MRKPTICICANRGADQLRSNCEADQHLCFCYMDSTIPLLLISSFKLWLYSLVCVGPGRKPKLLVFSCTGLINAFFNSGKSVYCKGMFSYCLPSIHAVQPGILDLREIRTLQCCAQSLKFQQKLQVPSKNKRGGPRGRVVKVADFIIIR